MTTRDEWLALAARCEAAEGDDFALNVDLRNALAYTDFIGMVMGLPGKRYTASIDAASYAVWREFPGMSALMAIGPEEAAATLHTRPLGTVGSWFPHASAATPALALMAALCRAKAEQPS